MTTQAQRSFSGGEIAPALYARADQTKYATGLKTCRNFLVMRHGGVANRPGTKFIAEVKTSANRTWLRPFVFSDAQTYVLEFGNLYMRVYRDAAQLLSGGVPYEIVTPYVTADLQTLQFVQSGDVVTIVHPNYEPRKLSRTGHTAWTLSVITFAPTLAAPTGVAVTAGAAGSKTFTYKVTAVDTETFEESLESAQGQITLAADPTSAAPHTVTWTAVTGAEEYNVYRQLNGVFGYIGTAIGTTFSDTGYVVDAADTPPQARNPFVGAGNYPASVGYYQQRLCLAGTNNKPEQIDMSRSANFNNMTRSSPVQADDAITFTLTGKKINRVRHIVDLNKMIVLTESSEISVGGGEDDVITPSRINPKTQSHYGASFLPPVLIGGNALYVQSRQSIVRDIGFDLQADGYKGNDLTIFAVHLFDGYTIEDWAYQYAPHSIVWAVRSDGTLLGLTYIREHQVWGWHRHDTGAGGVVESVCSVPEGAEDAVYLIVKRTINGATKRYVERMAARPISGSTTLDVADSFFVDCGLSYDGTNLNAALSMTLSGGTNWTYTEALTLTASAASFVAGDVGNAIILDGTALTGGAKVIATITGYTSATVVTVSANKTVPASMRNVAMTVWAKAVDELAGLSHLEGQVVNILADGYVEPQRTVTGGAITLTRPYAVIHVGLPITADFETLDLDRIDQETMIGKSRLVTRLNLFVESSRGIWAGPDAAHLREYKQRATENYGEPIALKTGAVDVNLDASWNTNGRIFVRQTDPLPLSILAAVPGGYLGR